MESFFEKRVKGSTEICGWVLYPIEILFTRKGTVFSAFRETLLSHYWIGKRSEGALGEVLVALLALLHSKASEVYDFVDGIV